MQHRQPIKRHEALRPLSHDHHEGLLLCWKIKQGLKKNIEPGRMMAYARHFFDDHLRQHFLEEEQFLFPLLGKKHPQIKKAIAEHRLLENIIFKETDLLKACIQLPVELDAHIRFEERELFNAIQKIASAEELQTINKQLHLRTAGQPTKIWKDPFWEKTKED